MSGLTEFTEVVETDRLLLRVPTMSDFDAHRAFFSSERSSSIGGPLSPSDVWRVFASHVGHWALKGFGWFILHDKDGPRGMVGVHQPPHYEAMELGWALFDEAATGRGYATEAAGAVKDWAQSALRPKRLVSFIDPANSPSRAVADRLGATNTMQPAVHNPECEVWEHRLAA